MIKQVGCATCHYRDWSLPDTKCKTCIGFKNWEPPRKVVTQEDLKHQAK